MAKDKYYFPHDYNARSDPKIEAMVLDYQSEGYGLYWAIIENMYEEEFHKLPLKPYIYKAIAKQMMANAEQVEAFVKNCLNEYELFASDGDFFWSARVVRNIEKREELSKIRSEIGKKGAIAKQKPGNSPAIGKQTPAKERKGKEIKRNSILFDDFWELYNKKVGAKKKCEKKWNNLNYETQKEIIDSLPNWLKQFKDKQFQPYPETYLNQERWNDEIKEAKSERLMMPEFGI